MAITAPPESVAATNINLFPSIKFQKNNNNNIFCKRLDFSRELELRQNYSSATGTKDYILMQGFKRVLGSSMGDEGLELFHHQSLSQVPGGLEATLNNLSKWVVSATFIATVLCRRDPEASWALAGAVLNFMFSMALKRLLNQERPISTIRQDPGMPSSHSQSIFYTLIFLTWSLAEWYGVNGFTTALSGLFFTLGSYLSWLRVSQKQHTTRQVIVGAVIGSVFSIFWGWYWNNYVSVLVSS